MKMKSKANLNLFHAKFGIKFRGFFHEISEAPQPV